MEEDHTVLACPECTSSRIHRRITTNDWRCQHCGAEFDEAEERAPKKDSHDTRNPEHTAAKLEATEVDPDR